MKDKLLTQIYENLTLVVAVPEEDVLMQTDTECCCDMFDQCIDLLTQIKNQPDHDDYCDSINEIYNILMSIYTVRDPGMMVNMGAETANI